MLKNVFEAVKENGQLIGKNPFTKAVAPEGLIRDIQLKNAYKNRQIIIVDTDNGKTIRVSSDALDESVRSKKKSRYDEVVDNRNPQIMFDNLIRLTKMVAKDLQPSLLVTGQPGLGKTFLVKRTLEECGIHESYGFVHYKGRATAAGLFMALYEHSDKVIVFDDCDSVFKDDEAVNILKAALDSYDTRTISYLSSRPIKDEQGVPIPRSFDFHGKVIFISNKAQDSLDDAIKSRSFVADISMTIDQMFIRIEQLMDKMEKQLPMEAKQKALAIMKELHKQYDGVEINLRSFIKASRICAMGFPEAESMIAEQIILS